MVTARPSSRKRCAGPCGRLRPAAAFHRNPTRADGLASWCRDCKAADARRRRRTQDPAAKRRRLAGKRAQAAARTGGVTEAEWDALVASCGGRCMCCDRVRKLTRDHVVPLSEGGEDTIENLQALCLRCNSRKGTRTIDYRRRAQ